MTETQPKRIPVPPMIHRYPECPGCGKGVDSDGAAWWCDTCGFTWESDGYDAHGELHRDVDQCSAEDQPYQDSGTNIAHYRYRCFRAAGHPLTRLERHTGARCDGGSDYDGYPHEWDADPDEDGCSTPRPDTRGETQ